MPRLPSSDSISADSSPTSYAPRRRASRYRNRARCRKCSCQESFGVSIADRLLHDHRKIPVLTANVVYPLFAPPPDRRSSLLQSPNEDRAQRSAGPCMSPARSPSPLHSTYFVCHCLGTNDHFMPVENPAPPRPRNPEFFTSLIMASASIPSAFARPCSHPVRDSGHIRSRPGRIAG